MKRMSRRKPSEYMRTALAWLRCAGVSCAVVCSLFASVPLC